MDFTAQELIDELTPKETSFEVRLKSGRVLIVRQMQDTAELFSLQKRSADLAKSASKGLLPKEWKPFLPIDASMASNIYVLSEYVVSPKFTDMQAAQFLKQASIEANSICAAIYKKWRERNVVE